jgi:hypothetical protein
MLLSCCDSQLAGAEMPVPHIAAPGALGTVLSLWGRVGVHFFCGWSPEVPWVQAELGAAAEETNGLEVILGKRERV